MQREEGTAKEAMEAWLNEMKEVLLEIESHMDALPDQGAPTTDEDFEHVAKMWARVGAIASASELLYEGLRKILKEKLEENAKKN